MKTPPEFELYDLQTDTYEFKNLVNNVAHDKTFAELKKQLQEWRVKTNDPFLKRQNLLRLKSEVDACFVEGVANKQRLELNYADYFFAE